MEILQNGGGGGANYLSSGYGDGNGGSGGGYIGVTGQTINFTNGYGHGYGTGGTQTECGSTIWISDTVSLDYTWFLDGIFGSAGKKVSNGGPQSAGGGGFYGGDSGDHGGGSGGSGYIGNSTLTNKSMYCYNCEETTKTISARCANEMPTENCSKIGNGFARITLIT